MQKHCFDESRMKVKSVKSYDQRGAAEQWIKYGKSAK
jgi:hypothetical protein